MKFSKKQIELIQEYRMNPTREKELMLRGVLDDYFQLGVYEEDARVHKIQETAVSPAQAGNFATPAVLPVGSVKALGPSIDEGYKRIFKWVDFTGTPAASFNLDTATSGVTFRQYQPGAPIQVDTIEGSNTSVSFILTSAAVNWLDTWFKDQTLWRLADTVESFTRAHYDEKATRCWGLVEAIAATYDLAWQGSGSATTDVVFRDASTINKACVDILTRCKSLKYPVSAAARFVVAAPIDLKSRVLSALGIVRNNASNPQQGQVDFNVEPVFTTYFATKTKLYVALAPEEMTGLVNAGGDRQLLTTVEVRNDLVAGGATTFVGNARYIAAVGNIQLMERCATA